MKYSKGKIIICVCSCLVAILLAPYLLTRPFCGAPDKPCGRAVQMLTQKHVAKRYMIAKKVVPLHYESEWQYKHV